MRTAPVVVLFDLFNLPWFRGIQRLRSFEQRWRRFQRLRSCEQKWCPWSHWSKWWSECQRSGRKVVCFHSCHHWCHCWTFIGTRHACCWTTDKFTCATAMCSMNRAKRSRRIYIRFTNHWTMRQFLTYNVVSNEATLFQKKEIEEGNSEANRMSLTVSSNEIHYPTGGV